MAPTDGVGELALQATLRAARDADREVAPVPLELDATLDAPRGGSGLQPGVRIGKYELSRELGRGGMGVVFLTRDHR